VPAWFPAAPEQLTVEWLQAAFAASGTPGCLQGFRSESLPGVGLVAHLERVHLEWAEASTVVPMSAIAKFPALGEATRAVGTVLRMYEREARFYERLAPLSPMATPALYGVGLDPESQDFVLLLQDLQGRFVDQMAGCPFGDAERLVDALAGHHARFWNGAGLAAESWIPRLADAPYPELFSGLFRSSWARAEELFPASLNDAARAVGAALLDHLPSVMDRLSEPPFTFSHGDFRIDNVCFDHSGQPWVFDWQLCDLSKGPRDLSYFLAQSVSMEELAGRHHELLARYVDGLRRGGVTDYDPSVALDDYRLAMTFAFIIPIVAVAALTHQSERHLAVCQLMIERCAAAFDELDVPALFD
jgi:hypothetical protein